MNLNELLEDNIKLIEKFGAEPIEKLKEIPEFYTFRKKLVFSHRDFDKFLSALKEGESCAIVSGFNASGTIHLGHKAVFDTNLFFQKKYGIPVFIPISDDESYVTRKVETQKEALKNAIELAKELIAYGFDKKKTKIIIDQIYTNIYNFAIKLSRKITISEVKATYGYDNSKNPGLFFYPCVQAAHVLLPMEKYGIENILVPIGPDEDSHLRLARDIAARANYKRPAVLHLTFMPGIDGKKMSKSRNNIINFLDDEKTIRKKVFRAFSGGAPTIEEHRKFGGDPTKDIACFYLAKYFLSEKEGEKLYENYRAGKLLSGDVKNMLAEKLIKMVSEFKKKLEKVSIKDLKKVLLFNESVELERLLE